MPLIASKLGRESQAKHNKPSPKRKRRANMAMTAQEKIDHWLAFDMKGKSGRKWAALGKEPEAETEAPQKKQSYSVPLVRRNEAIDVFN
jgi:hypothetical protein